MPKFKHILYYDIINPIRNSYFENELPKFGESYTAVYVGDDYPKGSSADAFSTCDCLVTGVFDTYGERLAGNPAIRYIFMLASDVSDFASIDLIARKIKLDNGAGYSTEAVAELSIAVLILLMRNLQMGSNTLHRLPNIGSEVQGGTLGVIGAGRIGTAVGLRAKALGMDVRYYSRSQSQDLDQIDARQVELDELVGASDAISVNLPLNDGTRGILDSRIQRLIRPNTAILCPSRPELFDLGGFISNAQEKGLKIWFDGIDDVVLSKSFQESKASIMISPSIAAGSINAQLRLIELARQGLEAQVLTH